MRTVKQYRITHEEGPVLDLEECPSLPAVIFMKSTRWLSRFLSGSAFADCPPALFAWTWIRSIFFLYLGIGAFLSFISAWHRISNIRFDTPEGSGANLALLFFSSGCEFFFKYTLGVPRVLVQRLLEALFGIGEVASLVAWQAILATTLIIGTIAIVREWRRR